MTVRLEIVEIANPCQVPWESMAGDDRSRHCSTCKLDVHNLAELDRAEAEALIASRQDRLCLRVVRRADGTVVTKDCAPLRLRALRRTARRSIAFAAVMAGAIAGMLGATGWLIAGEPLCTTTHATQGWSDRLANALADKIDPQDRAVVGDW